jgi:HD superfamily phosphohydrolase
MDEEEGVISVMPLEETIIDPLYEPLKLNRYELCLHLQRLKDGSHVRHGVSPYLLFDVEGRKEVVKALKGEVSAKESEEFGRLCEDFIKSTVFREKLMEYLEQNKRGRVNGEDLNKFNKNLKRIRKDVRDACKDTRDKYREILNESLYKEPPFDKYLFEKISHLFQLAHPVKVTCPTSKGKEQFMCEEGKIYSLMEELLRTFELRRAKWLYMSGSLHTVHRTATHTRLSHQIGSMIVGVNALREIDVYPYDEVMMSLGEYLVVRGDLHEFLMANFLHDIGHSPLSHVLEQNPFIELDHEEITGNLILGEKIKTDEDIDWYVTERYLLKMKAIKEFEYRFFKNKDDPVYKIKGCIRSGKEINKSFLECLKNNNEVLDSEIVTVSEVLENFGMNKWRIVEILTGKIFCPHCKKTLFTIKEIESGKDECSSCNKKINADEVGYEKIHDTQFLNKLIHSEIDLDRIDHVKRDSEICGLSLTSFRLTELLGSISLVLPDSRVHNDVYVDRSSKPDAEIKSPYIVVSQDGLSYLMDLLNSRRAIYNNIMFSDENNWINGVANQITALAVRYLPHLANMLPFITDQILAHFFTNELFLGTPIEKLNLLFQGKNDYSSYGEPMRYKLRDREVVTREDLKNMYVRIEEINNKERYDKMRVPAVVFYTNIKPTECPECGGELEDNGDGSYRCNVSGKPIKEAAVSEYQKEKDEKKRSWDDMLVYGKKFITTDGPKYLKFKELLIRGEKGKYNDTSREMFSDKPNELDVKNLFYVWIYDFVIKADTDDKNKSEEKCKNYIKKRIGGIWASNEGKEEFEKRFVDLDDAKEGSKLKHV